MSVGDKRAKKSNGDDFEYRKFADLREVPSFLTLFALESTSGRKLDISV